MGHLHESTKVSFELVHVIGACITSLSVLTEDRSDVEPPKTDVMMNSSLSRFRVILSISGCLTHLGWDSCMIFGVPLKWTRDFVLGR